MGDTLKPQKFKTSPDMLEWQYSQLLFELGEIQRHDADPTCPCRLSTDLGENCLAKHSLGLSGLAAETMAMDAANVEMLDELAADAREKHKAVKEAVCHKGEAPELMEWSRQWRKRIEPLYYACSTRKKARVHDSLATLFEPITVTGKCTPQGACDFKVKNAQPDVERSTSSVSALDRLIKDVARAPTAPAVSDRTYAMGITGGTRYEFQFKVLEAKDLVVSHDPFTFVPNPNYPQELQPRLRDRAATRLQVENIAANLNPAALIDDYHSIDRGAPIIGPDKVVESGNGRVMALTLAAEKHPQQYAKYLDALRVSTPSYGIPLSLLDGMTSPILVRARLSNVTRQQFVQEANASTSIEASAIEKARTDAEKITPEMITGLDVLEGEGIEDALRSTRNKQFVSAFLAKLPANEQARLVDAKGLLSQDGVRRAAMALFVATFRGDVGIRLAEKFYESTDVNVRNVFNGIARSLGLLARAESLAAAGQRQAEYSIGDDLAKAVSTFSAVRKTPGMTVTKYMAQMQLEQRELTPFQERLLVVLDEYSRSAKRTAAIFGGYAQLVIDSPPPSQGSFMPEAVATKEQLFELAVRRAVDASLEDVGRLFDHSWLAQKVDKCNLSIRDVDAALAWRPLREFVAFAVGLDKPVALCSTGMVYGTYQLTVGNVKDIKEVLQLTKRAGAVPNMKRVYQFASADLIYQVVMPANKKEDVLTWAPQEVSQQPARREAAEQAALFAEGNMEFGWKDTLFYLKNELKNHRRELFTLIGRAPADYRHQLELADAHLQEAAAVLEEVHGEARHADLHDSGPVIRVTGKCDDPTIKSCTFNVRKIGATVKVTGQKALSDAINTISYGRAKLSVRMESPKPVCSEAQNEKREHLIRVLKARNEKAGCCKIEGNGSKTCPNVFAVAASRIPCRPGKAGVQDAELEAVGEALERTEVVDA